MRKTIVAVIGGLAFLAGCGEQGNKPTTPPAAAKVKVPYHLEFDTKAAKPSSVGVTLPPINYTANSNALERRACLVIRFDSSGVKAGTPAMDQMIMAPVDLPDPTGVLPAAYMDSANKGLAKLLGDAGMQGTVKVKVILVRSSIKPNADDGEIDAKRLSDWVPVEVVFKNPHPKRQLALR